MSELLTVKEVAEIANVTTQAIYQRLKKDLKPYVEYENGKTALNPEVLKVLNREDHAKPADNTSELLQTTIEALMEQLSIKDTQITTFQDEVIKQNEHSREQSAKLIALVEQVNELQKNNQILLKAEQDRKAIPSREEPVQEQRAQGWFSRLFRSGKDG